jgi:outer membrane lipoprotein-sorting protein
VTFADQFFVLAAMRFMPDRRPRNPRLHRLAETFRTARALQARGPQGAAPDFEESPFMYRVVAISLSLLATLVAPLSAESQQKPAMLGAQNDGLYKRMVALNASLRSYTADVHLEVALKTFPYISPALDGAVYYKKPDKQAVVFDTVPALASQFKKVYPRVDPPSQWMMLYSVAVLGDDGSSSTFRLVPKKNGRVDHLDVKVDDSTATIREYTWTYKDGGSVSFDQSFTSIAGNYLPDKQTGHVDLPSYKADVTSAFSNYKLNVAVADSVFVEK